MELTIKAEAQEIAALVLEIQERQEEFVPSHGFGVENEEVVRTNSPVSTSTPCHPANH